jgi:cation diffusion facilitator CzcD-associated flavoprotein CzcO
VKIAMIGAGVAGLTTAKVLVQAGHGVEVFDKAPDVGGVWSRTRRYPGLTTQSPSAQYSFSDFPMPKGFPEWPTGAQVEEYLTSYATASGLDPLLRLSTTVTHATPAAGGRWRVDTNSALGVAGSAQFDSVVVANGIFCEPAIPQFDGKDEYATAGGRIVAATDLNDVEQARDKCVLVVGYGKTACDVTVPISEVAASTDLIARQLLWKVPRKIARVLNFQDAPADPARGGPLPLPAAARPREVPPRAGQRNPSPDAQLDRIGVGPPVDCWCSSETVSFASRGG